jgi:hypothetical protein
VAASRYRHIQLAAVACDRCDRRSAALRLGAILSCPGNTAAADAVSAAYTGTLYLVVAGALYALAKLFELLDHAVHSRFILSGHTIKHLLGAAACFVLLRYFQTRRPLPGPALMEPTSSA